MERKIKCELYRDSMQNYKKYGIRPAQLIIADVPYNVGANFYGSNPMWYKGGDNKNGESKLAGKAAFNSDFNFNLYEYFHFCSKMMKKEDKKSPTRGRSSNSPCMIVFCSFEQTSTLIAAAKKTWIYSLHSIGIHQELFTAGIKSEYESSWGYRICTLLLQRQTSKVQKRSAA